MNLRRTALLEVAAFYSLVMASIWLGQSLPHRPPVLVAGVLLVAVCALSNRYHRDSRRRIGLAGGDLVPCARLTAKVAAGPLLLLAAAAAQHPAPPLPKIAFGILGYPVWAFAQEYALLSFIANRLRDVLGDRPWTVAFLNGTLFALAHLPNPLLMTAGFVAGIAFTRIFLRTPHLVPIALAHAAAGFLLSWIFLDFEPAMKVGPAYMRAVVSNQ